MIYSVSPPRGPLSVAAVAVVAVAAAVATAPGRHY